MQTIWKDDRWQPCGIQELLTPANIKKKYRKAMSGNEPEPPGNQKRAPARSVSAPGRRKAETPYRCALLLGLAAQNFELWLRWLTDSLPSAPARSSLLRRLHDSTQRAPARGAEACARAGVRARPGVKRPRMAAPPAAVLPYSYLGVLLAQLSTSVVRWCVCSVLYWVRKPRHSGADKPMPASLAAGLGSRAHRRICFATWGMRPTPRVTC